MEISCRLSAGTESRAAKRTGYEKQTETGLKSGPVRKNTVTDKNEHSAHSPGGPNTGDRGKENTKRGLTTKIKNDGGPDGNSLHKSVTADPKPEREKEMCAGSDFTPTVKNESVTDHMRRSRKIGENQKTLGLGERLWKTDLIGTGPKKTLNRN
jgi:hypothetical protein